jgi:molybdate transport repressor ModE-like protein
MPFFDNKTAMLLMLVDETKSVRAAGQRMQLSYSSCWNLIRTLESQVRFPLIIRTQGGAGGSMSMLSDEGRKLLELFNAFQEELRQQADTLYEKYFQEVF